VHGTVVPNGIFRTRAQNYGEMAFLRRDGDSGWRENGEGPMSLFRVEIACLPLRSTTVSFVCVDLGGGLEDFCTLAVVSYGSNGLEAMWSLPAAMLMTALCDFSPR